MAFENLKQFASELKTKHPTHTRIIHNGLALALLGRVQLQEGGFKGGTVGQYTVTCDTPSGGWHCTCPQGSGFGPKVDLFIGQPASHFCKHIAALGICWWADTCPGKPATIFEALTSLIDAEEVPMCGDSLPITKTVKLAHRTRAGKPVLELVNGHARSQPLAVWATDPGQTNRGYWKLLPEAQDRYEEFRVMVTSGSSVEKVAA